MTRRRSLLAVVIVLLLAGGMAMAYWSAGSTPGGNGAAAAATVQRGATPTAVAGASGAVTLSWAASTLSTGQAVGGYRIDRYATGGSTAQAVQAGCSGTVTALTCTETNVPTGSWQYTVTPLFATAWSGAASDKSAAVAVDQTPPVNGLSLSAAGGTAYLSGGTLWYRGAAAGSFALTNAVTDADSGPASSQTSALGGSSSGWSHTPSTVTTPASGPYVSNTFSWAGGTNSSPTETVVGRDTAGNTSATALTFSNDGGNPNYGSIDYPDGYTTGRSVTLTFSPGYDGESGVDPTMNRLKRYVAPLVNGVCGSYTTNNNFALGATSPFVDITVRAGQCYAYQLVASDRVGNKQFYSSANVVKVDYAGAVMADSSLLSYWRFGESAITSSDSFTDTAGTALTSHTSQDGSTWTRRTGDTGTMVVTPSGGLRGSSTSRSVYYTDETPASADYLVEADVLVRSVTSGNSAGVVGRLDTSGTGAGTYYSALYNSTLGRWELSSNVNGTTTLIGSYTQALSTGSKYRVGLDLRASAIRLMVDGVVRVSGTDSSIATAGRAGVLLATDNAASDTTGLHLDNLEVSPPAADSRGTNSADYHRGVTQGVPGITAGNTAARFDGVDDYVKSTTADGFPVGASARSVELWFKTPGVASGQGRQALFSYGTSTDTQEYGVWLETNGTQIKSDGGGASDRVLTWSANFNDNQWHHFVSTYDGTSQKMYVDGVLGSGNTTATRNTVVNPALGFAVGAILDTARGGLATASFFNGSLDELSFYSTALSPATITNHYQLGTSPAPDFTGPTGGSVQATGLSGTGATYSTSTTLNLALAKGSDPSGIVTTGNQLLRSTAPLSQGTCGSYGGYTQVGANDPGASVTDTVADGACYRYQYVVLDVYGNSTTYTSSDIAVDTTAPAAPPLNFSGFTNTSSSGSTVYYRSAAGSGSVTATANGVDPASGIVSYSFPALGTNWTSTPGPLGVTTYSWTGTPQAPGTMTVTATNNAGLTSPGTPLTFTADDTAPGTGSVTYADGSTSGSTVSVAFTTGTDAGSGIGTRLLQRASAPATASTCGTFGSFTTVSNGTNPTSPVVDAIADRTCYQYRYVVADRVGNQTVASSTNVAHAAFGATWSFDAGSGTTAVDSSANANTVTLQGNATWGPGRIGPFALRLSGGGGFATSTYPVVDTSQSYSVAAWVNFSDTNGYQTVVAMDGNSVSPFYLQKNIDGRFSFGQFSADSTGAANRAVLGLYPVTGTWYHLVGVYDKTAGTISLYVNGNLQGMVTGASGFTATGSTTVGRAKYNGGPTDQVNGSIDDVRIVDRVLTQAEITALAQP